MGIEQKSVTHCHSCGARVANRNQRRVEEGSLKYTVQYRTCECGAKCDTVIMSRADLEMMLFLTSKSKLSKIWGIK